MPTVVWVWDMTTFELHTILLHINPVKAFKFAPHSQQLVIGTGMPRVFVWTPTGSCVISLPQYMDVQSGLNVIKVKWNPRGSNLVLSDKNLAILAFPSAELANTQEVVPMTGFVTSPKGIKKMII